MEVCRCVLGNEADAEDAFQATFLVLASKAKSIRKVSSLASWLHGVAYRSSLKARAQAARRQKHERQAWKPTAVDAPDELTWREVRQIVHEELNRLADRFRAPLVLCYLEGKPQDRAAAELGLAKGAFRGRLERGREQLRRRLVRRGLGATAAVLASSWPLTVSASVPAQLVTPTVQAAAGILSGPVAAGVISARVLAISAAVMKGMTFSKLKPIAVVLLAIILGGGTLHLYHALATESPMANPPTQAAGELAENRKELRAPPSGLPDVWELDFENGLPAGWSRGTFAKAGLPRGSQGAVGAIRADHGKDGVYFEIGTPKSRDGLFAIREDSHLHFTYKMDQPGWMNVFIVARAPGPEGRHSGNYLFNEDIYPQQRGKWHRVSIPLSTFFRAGQGKGPPPSEAEIPYMVFFSAQRDRGLVIDRVGVTRGGPGSVNVEQIE